MTQFISLKIGDDWSGQFVVAEKYGRVALFDTAKYGYRFTKVNKRGERWNVTHIATGFRVGAFARRSDALAFCKAAHNLTSLRKRRADNITEKEKEEARALLRKHRAFGFKKYAGYKP
jgi:hypothetical protein